MAQNMMNSAHKTTNKNYRDHYDETFGKAKKNESKDRKSSEKD